MIHEQLIKSIASSDTLHKFNKIIKEIMLLTEFKFKIFLWRKELVNTKYLIYFCV